MEMVTTSQVLTVAGALIGAMFGLLIMMVGWVGNKLYTKLDEVGGLIRAVERDVHGRITELDRRVAKVEVRCEMSKRGHDEF